MLRQREARIRQKAYNNEAMLKRQSYLVKGSRICIWITAYRINAMNGSSRRELSTESCGFGATQRQQALNLARERKRERLQVG